MNDKGIQFIAELRRFLFLTIGIGFLLIAVSVTINNLFKLSKYEFTEGEVVSTTSSPNNGKFQSYNLTVKYETRRSNVTSSTNMCFQKFEKGKKLSVYYDPYSPREFTVNHFFTIWLIPVFFYVIGLFWVVPFVKDEIKDWLKKREMIERRRMKKRYS